MIASNLFAIGTFKGSVHLHIFAYTAYHPLQPVCSTRKPRCPVVKAQASVKDVDCPRCLNSNAYKKLLSEYVDRSKPSYLEQCLAELGAKPMSLSNESAPEQRPFRGLRLVMNAEKQIRCTFFTLVVRIDALREKYKGGIGTFVEKYSPRLNRHLAVLCSMGWEDLDEPLEDLVENGLEGEKDFYCFDAARLSIGIDAMKKMEGHTEKPDFGIPWLRGYEEKGGVMVYFAESE